MLTVIRDNQGHLLAACEWWTVNEEGRWFGGGKYIFVSHIEVSKGAYGLPLIRDVIALIAWEEPQAISAYWRRTRHTGEKKLREYPRARLLRMVAKEQEVVLK